MNWPNQFGLFTTFVNLPDGIIINIHTQTFVLVKNTLKYSKSQHVVFGYVYSVKLISFLFASAGVISTVVPDSPHKIFIGGLPNYLNEDQVRLIKYLS